MPLSDLDFGPLSLEIARYSLQKLDFSVILLDIGDLIVQYEPNRAI